ncbi:MAG: DUF1302 domain-containing protein [Deferrisomatales bacterium]|nr:DUF1302 domain-containing protein [Deferrisomatales bacterium]
MKKTAHEIARQRVPARGLVALAASLLLLLPTAGGAFQLYDGDYFQVRLDTTLSYGVMWRVQKRDKDLIGIENGGRAFSLNGDDGNLNYDRGVVSNLGRITSELEIRGRDVGAFFRGTAFYDYENMRRDRARTSLSDDAKELVGKDIDLLDAYVWGRVNLGTRPAQLRVGEQVVSWGESTFIQNSINVLNPINVAALRQPGSELKEALVPEGMVWGSLGLSRNLSLEAVYLYDWEPVEIDPVGSYFSTSDIVGAGGKKVMLGFGAFADGGNAEAADVFQAVPRGSTRDARDQGQYGAALRVFAPGLNDTEFGFFYINYHSRLPVISSRTGTLAGVAGAGAIGSTSGPLVAQTVGAQLVGGATPEAAVEAGIAAGTGAGMTQDQAAFVAGVTANQIEGFTVPAAISAAATDAYAKTAHYFTEYPEDIKLFGVSFNTLLRNTGIALQGEISHRRDVPLQVDDLELLFATLGTLNADLADKNQLENTYMKLEHELSGYILRNMTQVQVTGTKVFGPGFLWTDQSVLLGEVGYTRVHNMPDKSDLRLEAPGTFISGNEDLAYTHGKYAAGLVEPASAFADANSWGYRLVYRLDFNNAVGAVNLSPRVAWAHDVRGNTPGPGGNFLEGRRAATLGIGATYQSSWSGDLSYTNFFGAGRQNLINDRDFVALNIKYSF